MQVPVASPGVQAPLATWRTPPPTVRPGFGAGITALFSGFGFLVRTPAVWPLAMVPMAIAVVLTSLLSWLAIATIPGWIAGAIGPGDGAWSLFTKVVEIVATLVAILAALLVGFGLAQPLSGPALERIVRSSEADLGAPTWPATTFFADVVRSVESLLLSYSLGLPILALLFVVEIAFAPAAVVTIPLKLVVAAMMIAWDVFDYPLSIRGIPVRTRVRVVRDNLGAVFGFGLGIALLTLVSCGLLVLPAGVAGAARLLTSIERWEERERARALGGGALPAAAPHGMNVPG